ncbi:endonuclease/Exonuclease/phosphatase [Aphelenchoides avenae]|nr:endonuclease/Exonuclease/phosphatase [Aphelenchus avenae]
MTSTFYTSASPGTANGSAKSFPPVESDPFVDDLLHSYEDRYLLVKLVKVNLSHRFCAYPPATIFATTFNVNGRSPPEILSDWVHFENGTMPDFVVIGLQEMDLALGTYVTDNTIRQDEWLFTLHRTLPSGYRQVEFVRLVGIFLVLYQHEDSKVKVSETYTSFVATGFLKFGNKGGVGVSLMLNDSLVCFINSHLAAGSELTKRNQDFREISQMRFANGRGLYDHDAVFWLGDLNYRLNTPLTYEEVVRECNSNRYKALFHFDQLKEQQRLKAAFNGFHEAVPSFRPTYKFDVGTNTWDTSEKRRIPAWCDRVLFWTRDKTVKVEQKTYRSVESISFSDHKPVCSLLEMKTKVVDRKRRNAVHEEVLRESDKKVNDMLPQITLSKSEFLFGDVYYRQPAVQVLTIKNTGLTATCFAFAPTHQSSDMPENWLTVTPKSSFLEIGAEVEITLQVVVDNEQAWALSDGKKTDLSCILIVRLDHGCDYFIVASANYRRSCFGSSFYALLKEGPKLPSREDWLIDLGDATPDTNASDPRVPIQLYWLSNAIRARGLEGIRFNEAAFSDDSFFKIRDALDEGRPQDLLRVCGDSSTLYSSLLLLLGSFKEAVIPPNVPIDLLSPGDDAVSYIRVLTSIPVINRGVLEYLMELFRELMVQNKESHSQVQLLADLLFRKTDVAGREKRLNFFLFCFSQKSLKDL